MSSSIGRYVVIIRRKNAGWIQSTENDHKNEPGVDITLESKASFEFEVFDSKLIGDTARLVGYLDSRTYFR